MLSLLFVLALSLCSTSSAFIVLPKSPAHPSTSVEAKKHGDETVVNPSFPAGTFIEFTEKKRSHVGKIDTIEPKSSGGVRYHVIDSENHKFNIPDKDVKYAMPCPSSPGQANKLYDQFCKAQDAPFASVKAELDLSSDYIAMAWEEIEADEGLLTPASFIELVHAHTASAMEKYFAWKLLQSEIAHIFFKEIKDKGRVVSFKAKSRKAVEAAKQVFCRQHIDDNEVCFV